MKKQSCHVDTFCDHPRFNFLDPDHRPHWLRYGNGQAHGEIVRYGNGTVSFDITEISLSSNSSKRIMVTLTPELAAQLKEFLS